MTVLVCIPCLLTGGTEIQTLSLVEALVAAGHRPVVACYFEHSGAMVERYRRAGAEVRLLSAEGVRPRGLRAVAAHLWRGLRGVVRDVRPAAAHVQYMAPGALVVMLLRLAGVSRIVATTHTDADIYSRNGLRVVRMLTRSVLSGFQCITLRAERSYFGSSAMFMPGKRQRHFTIYNCLPGYISIAPREPRQDGVLTIGVVSRLELIKGMDLVVPAFAQVASRHGDVRLLVVGDGSLRAAMERQAEEAGLGGRVEFAGRQPQDALQGYYDRIDVLLMPSRSEGFGLTAIEGMARGCVPVVSDTGGLPEVVTDGSGLLHRPGDAGSIADCVEQLVSDRVLLAGMSAAAVERARVFSRERYNEAVKSWYDNLQ